MLETVFLSEKTKINNQVRIYKDEVQYLLCKGDNVVGVIKDGRVRTVSP